MCLRSWAVALLMAALLYTPVYADVQDEAVSVNAGSGDVALDVAGSKANTAKKKKQKNALQVLIDNAAPGSTVELPDGEFEASLLITTDNLTIEATGTTIFGKTYKGKGAVYVPKDIAAVTIVGLECHGVRGDPGPCVRSQQTAGSLHLRNVYFHDADEGVLGCGNSVTIENSRFETLGRGGRQHGIYVGRDCQTLIVRGSIIADLRGEAHGIKTGAQHTLIEDTEIVCGQAPGRPGAETSLASRPIDAFRGGLVTLRNVRISIGGRNQQNRPSCAHHVVGYGMEIARRGGWPDNAITLENLTVACLDKKVWVVRANTPAREALASLGQVIETFDPESPATGAILHENGVTLEDCAGMIQPL